MNFPLYKPALRCLIVPIVVRTTRNFVFIGRIYISLLRRRIPACGGANLPEGRYYPRMQQYECAVVLSTTLSEEQTQEQVEQVKAWIAGTGATVSDIDLWGRKRLAYPINKQRDGYYVIYYFTLETEGARLTELERRFQTSEAVIRHLVVRLPPLKETPRVPKEEEKEEKAEKEGKEEPQVAEEAAGGEAEEAQAAPPADAEPPAAAEATEAEAEQPSAAEPPADSPSEEATAQADEGPEPAPEPSA